MNKLIVWAGLALLIAHPAAAKENTKFYLDEPIKGYQKAEFVVLKNDDVNIRTDPETGNIIKTVNKHSLFRILKRDGKWLRVNSDGIEGNIYADFTGNGSREELTEEDFDDALLGRRFSEKEISGFGRLLQKSKIKKQILYEYELHTLTVNDKSKLVEAIEVRDPELITVRGISIGDGSWRLVGQYGVPEAVTYEKNQVMYEYFLKKENKTACGLTFFVDRAGNITKFILKRSDSVR